MNLGINTFMTAVTLRVRHCSHLNWYGYLEFVTDTQWHIFSVLYCNNKNISLKSVKTFVQKSLKYTYKPLLNIRA